MNNFRQLAFELIERHTTCPFRFRLNEIGHRFCLGSVQFAVEKGPLGKFTGFGQTCTMLKQCFQEATDNGTPSMTRQFHHIFTGIGVGRAKEGKQSLIYGLAMQINKVTEANCIAWKEGNILLTLSAENLLSNRYSRYAREADDGDGRFAHSRSNCSDSIFLFHRELSACGLQEYLRFSLKYKYVFEKGSASCSLRGIRGEWVGYG